MGSSRGFKVLVVGLVRVRDKGCLDDNTENILTIIVIVTMNENTNNISNSSCINQNHSSSDSIVVV